MTWRREKGEMLWHACANCEEWPQDGTDFSETERGPASEPGGAEENPICERCDSLMRSDACERA